MSSRSSDVLLVALLMVTTVVGVFQFQTHQTLQAIQQQMVKQSPPQGVATYWPYDPRTMMPIPQVAPIPQPAAPANIQTNQATPVTPATPAAPTPSAPMAQANREDLNKQASSNDGPASKVENGAKVGVKPENSTEKNPKPATTIAKTASGDQTTIIPKPPVNPANAASANQTPPAVPTPAATTNTSNPPDKSAASTDSVEKTTALTAAKAAANSAEVWKVYGPTLTNVLDQLLKGDLEKVYGQMDDIAKQATSKPMFLKTYDHFAKNHGGLKQVLSNHLLPEASAELFVTFDVTVQTELSEKVVFCISVNTQKQIGSIWMK